MILTVITFLIVLAILVLAHELGHFIAARKSGMAVEEFGIGFPPRVWKTKSKKTGTIYSINLLPLGGFVKIKGEDGEHKDESDSFAAQKLWKRAIVIVAGVVMNFLLCAVLLSVGYMIGLPSQVDQKMIDQGVVEDQKVLVSMVMNDKPAQQADIQLGDELVKIDGQQVTSTQFVQEYSNTKLGENITYEIKRGEETLTKEVEVVDLGSGQAGIGIAIDNAGIVKYPFHLAIYNGFRMTAILTYVIVITFYTIIKDLIIGAGSPLVSQISGPVGIAVLTGQVARMGVVHVMQFIAILSVNLAVINILPFPALDGGRLLFLAAEAIRRKPLNQKFETYANAIGFALLMLLVILVTFQDIFRFVFK